MINISFKKVFRDLRYDLVRTFLVVPAIALGIIGVTSASISYFASASNIDLSYMGTNPASVSIFTDPIKLLFAACSNL